MVSYVLIGIGGALGSLARAWVAVAMARVTGPAFPWGTILINVTGSFVIGFVASLTATDGRLSGLAELRSFLMIGFCGGYTTFSSFSLQTLDLVRDGRGAQAMGNVALSVALCLGAVALGHGAGVGLRPGRRVAEAVPAHAGEVLAVLDRAESVPAVLDAAALWRARTGAAGILALGIHPGPATSFLPSEEVLTAEHRAELEAVRGAGLAATRAAVDSWRAAHRDPPLLRWEDVEGHPAAALGAAGRAAGAIVMARPRAGGPPLPREALHAALFDTGRPVLLLPDAPGGGLGQVIALGWRDGDARAAAALAAAGPLLPHAARVVVLRVGAVPAIPEAVRAAGVPAHALAVPAGDGPPGAALLAASEAEGADLLVMGAYTHGSWREALLGGMTRHVLDHARIALLLRH